MFVLKPSTARESSAADLRSPAMVIFSLAPSSSNSPTRVSSVTLAVRKASSSETASDNFMFAADSLSRAAATSSSAIARRAASSACSMRLSANSDSIARRQSLTKPSAELTVANTAETRSKALVIFSKRCPSRSYSAAAGPLALHEPSDMLFPNTSSKNFMFLAPSPKAQRSISGVRQPATLG